MQGLDRLQLFRGPNGCRQRVLPDMSVVGLVMLRSIGSASDICSGLQFSGWGPRQLATIDGEFFSGRTGNWQLLRSRWPVNERGCALVLSPLYHNALIFRFR
jgi:hypothetical protein